MNFSRLTVRARLAIGFGLLVPIVIAVSGQGMRALNAEHHYYATYVQETGARIAIAIVQVGEAVSQMDQVTQQNAALVEESAAAAQSLKVQAQQLVQAVSVFRLSHHGSVGSSYVVGAVATTPIVELRRPDSAKDVTRLSFKSKPVAASKPVAEATYAASATARTSTDDWASF